MARKAAEEAARRAAEEAARKAAAAAAQRAAEQAAAAAAQRAAEQVRAQAGQLRQQIIGGDTFQRSAPAQLFGGQQAVAKTSTLATENRRDGQSNCLDQVGDMLASDPALRAQGEVIFLRDTRAGAEGQSGHVVIKRGNEIWDPATEQWSPAAQWLRANPQYQVAGTASGQAVHNILEAPVGDARNKAIAASGISPALVNMAVADEVDIFALPTEAETGAEAAALLMQPGLNVYNGINGDALRGADFAQLMREHADDPQFISDMLNALGPENTMQLMGYLSSQPEGDRRVLLEGQISSIAQGMDNALAEGPISPDFITQMAEQGGRSGMPYLAAIVSDPSTSNLAATRAAVQEALVERAVSEPQGTATARIAAEMLANDPEGIAFLEGMDPADREHFLENALSYSPEQPIEGLGSLGGAERLIGMAAESTNPDFRAHMFSIGASVLAGISPTPSSASSGPLLDNLKTLFQSDPQYITGQLFTQSASNPAADPTWSVLGNFFDQALFRTHNRNDPFIASVTTLMSDIRQDMLSAAEAGDVQLANSHAMHLGNVAGSLQIGFYQALADNQATAEGRTAFVGIITDGVLGVTGTATGLGGTASSVAANVGVSDVAVAIADVVMNGDLRANAGDMRNMLARMLSGLYDELRIQDREGADGLNMEMGVFNGVTQIVELSQLSWMQGAE
ncbi:MAG TPA: hypothetical protein VNA24_04720 [Hyalangium sp.]|nr:hypothetical protein [Hyalangium sp.]